MNINLDKKKWEEIGKTAGWLKTSSYSYSLKNINLTIDITASIDEIEEDWFTYGCTIRLPNGKIVDGTINANSNLDLISYDSLSFDEDCFVVKEDLIYGSAPYGIIGTIPAGTSAIRATNMPSENNIKYWAESWPNMSDKEESWQRNYGFGLEENDIINLKD